MNNKDYQQPELKYQILINRLSVSPNIKYSPYASYFMADLSLPDFSLFWEYVDYWAEQQPDFPSMNYNNTTVTSSELKKQSIRLAEILLHLGITKKDRIVTILPPLPEYIVLLTAANRIGAIIVPMDVRYRHTDFIRLVPKIKPKLIISIISHEDANFHSLLERLRKENKLSEEVKTIYLGDIPKRMNYYQLMKENFELSGMVEDLMKNSRKDQDFLIIWTGGTTGFPKAAVLTNHNVVKMCKLEHQIIKDGLRSRGQKGIIRYLANLPVSHVGGSVELMALGIMAGYKLIIHDRWSSTKTLETIQEEKLEVMLAAPTMYRIMMLHKNFENFDLSSLKLTIISGEMVNQEFIELMKSKFCDTIINGYGSTEMGPEITFTDPNDNYDKIAEGYVGKPLRGVEIKITNLEGEELPTGEIGEVLVKGDLVCRGYFNNPEENEQAFREGWFRTGDLGKLDETGGLWLQGRIKDIIRVGTYTVLPMEIEELVMKHFELELAAAISVPDEVLGEVVWLVVSPKDDESVTKEDLFNLCKRELADYKIPKKIIFYDIDKQNPPMTRIGKIDKNRLKEELLE